jgi:signal transduction histidine kinase
VDPTLERYRACLATAPAVLYELCVRTGALRWVSEHVESLGGHRVADVVGPRAHWLALVHPIDRARLEGAMRSALRAGRYDVEFRLRHAGGAYRWFRALGEIAADAVETGCVRGIAVMHEEQHRIGLRERAYRELVLGVSRSLVTAEVLVHVVDAACRLLDADRAKVYVPDVASGSLRNVAQSGAIIVPVIDIPLGDPDSLVARCFRTGCVQRVGDYGELDNPLAVRLRANHTGPVLVVPVFVAETPAAVLVASRFRGCEPFSAAHEEDATHLATQASFALANAHRYDSAVNDSAAKSSFLSVLGHELRTPLNTIEGFLELLALETPGPLNARQRDYVARVRRASGHVVRLAEDLFDLSRAELGQARLSLAEFDPREPLADAVDLVRHRAERAGLALDAPSPAGHTRAADAWGAPTLAYADPDRVRQILVNLLVNAVKFTPAGGIAAWIDADEDAVRFRVRDTGAGVAPELQPRIFEPFFQARVADRRSVEDGAGAGLGLALSRSLARAMGGELDVASRVGGGSTFTLTLPTSAAAARAAGQAALVPAGATTRLV